MLTTMHGIGACSTPLAGGGMLAAGFSAVALLVLTGCKVGPNYNGPPTTAQQTVDMGHFQRQGQWSPTEPPASIPSRWWDGIDDPLLRRLIDDALAASPRLRVALARVRSARAQLQVDRAKLLPTGGATASYARAHIPTDGLLNSGSSGGASASVVDTGLYTDGFDASWELDLFGGNRRGVESSQATAESQQAAFDDMQVRLASDVGKAYVQLREAQNRLFLLQQSVRNREVSMDLVQQQLRSGTASQSDLEQQARQLEASRADLPTLQFSVDQQLDQLAILTGRAPGSLDALLAANATDLVPQPMPPAKVAISEPYAWLRQRPDIRQAERTLAARTAKIGQNMADYFPKVQLLGFVGFSGSAPSGLVHGSPASIGLPSLSWNLLNLPSTRGKVRGAQADRDEAAADYERTVLEALQDANDALSRFGLQRAAVSSRQAAVAAAHRASALVHQRRTRGTATGLDAFDADRTALTDTDQLVQSVSQLMQAYLSLQKSLGLGWVDSASLLRTDSKVASALPSPLIGQAPNADSR